MALVIRKDNLILEYLDISEVIYCHLCTTGEHRVIYCEF